MNEDFLKEYITGKLDAIHEKKVGKVEPTYVLMVELTNSISKDVKRMLNKLFTEGDIKVGDTISDKYIVRKAWNKDED